MKKFMSVCLLIAMLCTLCACAAEQPKETQCSHEAYSDLIARLDAGDYEGARSMIDAMEGRQEPETTAPAQTQAPEAQIQTVPAATETQSQAVQEGDVVELTKYNVRDYFEFGEDYLIGEQSGCSQYVILKEEYQDRLIGAENVRVTVSYLLTEAYGRINMDADEFQSEYFDITSKERESKTVDIDRNHTGWISSTAYSSRKGCFPDFIMDVEIESGSGKLILSAE